MFKEDFLKKYHIFIIISLLLIIIILVLSIYCLKLKEEVIPPVVTPEAAPPPTLEERFEPGTVGEVKVPEIPEGIQPVKLPPVMFNTSGTIKEVKASSIIVQGSGSNFTDQTPRDLTLVFTGSTIVMEAGQKIEYRGLNGLKQLKPGMKISIQGDENIRGKTEFKVKYITIL